MRTAIVRENERQSIRVNHHISAQLISKKRKVGNKKLKSREAKKALFHGKFMIQMLKTTSQQSSYLLHRTSS